MKSEIRIDKIIRSKRKSFSIEINEKAELIIRAPLKASAKEINKLVEDKKKWITAKLTLMEEKNIQKVEKRFVEGEKFLFLGKEYPLSFSEKVDFAFGFDKDRFILNQKHRGYARNLFHQWYRLQAKSIFPQRVQLFSSLTGIEYNRVKISEAEKRWGSCSSQKNLNFSWKLVMAPSQVIDYVIVHEIAHIIELNHSKRFWDLVERMYPDYKQYKGWLRDKGHLLDI